MVQSQWKTVWQFLKKVSRDLPYDVAISVLGMYPKELKADTRADIYTLIAALFIRAKSWKQTKQPLTYKRINKIRHVPTIEYYSAFKKEGNFDT